MEILTFSQFRLLLEAGGTEPEAADPNSKPQEIENAPQSQPTQTTSSFIPPSQPFTPSPQDTSFELPEDPNAQPIDNGPKPIKFVLLDTSTKWHMKYSDGGGVKRYNEYQIMPDELDSWINSNSLSNFKNDIISSISGKTQLDKSVYDKLKNALLSKKIGKNIGISDIIYDPNNNPSTSDLDINFLKSK